ncbi:hypothetical protein AB723_19410, partial [Acinetobacter baumannii]
VLTNIGAKKRFILWQDLFLFKPYRRAAIAVSYTHLDVYKRQLEHRHKVVLVSLNGDVPG